MNDVRTIPYGSDTVWVVFDVSDELYQIWY